nr:hypothetical protein [Cyanobacteria bacterium UBA8530]
KRALDSVQTKRVLNADDPLTRSLGEKDSEFFGLSPECGEKDQNSENVLDGQTCKICGERLKYSVRFYGQLGDYECVCGFSRPSPAVEGKNLILSSEGYGFEALGLEAKIGSPGRYNVYNALAAMAGANAMGWPVEAIAKVAGDIRTDIGRMEKLKGPKDKQIVLTLVKNPTGLNEVLKVLAAEKRSYSLLMVLNDLAADGRDVSWIWDAGLERLERAGMNKLFVSGARGWDLAVRLKYANLGDSEVFSSPFQAIDDLIETSDYVHLLTTYTTLYALRDHLAKKGFKS